jgi:hypothetical protein
MSGHAVAGPFAARLRAAGLSVAGRGRAAAR